MRQSFDSPTVYLDHWAIRLLSDTTELQNRFVNALMSKNGTLLLSNFSFSEFSSASDSKHCLDAELFIERLLPNIYFTDFALDKVLEQEQQELNNSKRFWPSADLPQLKLFAERSQDSPLGFSMKGFIMMAHAHREQLMKVTRDTVLMIKDGLDAYRHNPSYVAKARNAIPSDLRPRTYIIIGELLRTFNLDNNSPITENDVMDMFHAAMPINCCDYVLLDGPWMERVEKMRLRIAKAQIKMPIAKCFSQRNNGVIKFLEDLESFDNSKSD